MRRRDGFQIGAVGWILLSPFIALMVLVSSAFILWPDGAAGLYRLIDRERQYANGALGERAQFPASLAEAAYQRVAGRFQATPPGPRHAAGATGEGEKLGDLRQNVERQILEDTRPVLETLALALWLVAWRLGVLVLALPAFVLAAGVGWVDGMAQRLLRRAGGARESAFLYHGAKRAGRAILVGTGLLYLAAPVALDPRGILLPAAIGLAFSLRMATGYFKKYL